MNMNLMDKLQEIMSDEIDKETIDLTLDLHIGTQKEITLKQADHNSRILKVTLTKNMLSIVKLHNSRVDLYLRKSDGNIVVVEGYDINAEDGEVHFSLTRQALSTLPSVECEVVKIGNDGSILSFPIFKIDIKDSIHDEAYDLIEKDEVTTPTSNEWGF